MTLRWSLRGEGGGGKVGVVGGGLGSASLCVLSCPGENVEESTRNRRDFFVLR